MSTATKARELTTDEQVIGAVMAVVVVGIYVGVSVVVYGAAGMVIWNWFMPQYGLPVITLAQSCAIKLTASVIFPRGVTPKETKGLAYDICGLIIGPIMVIAVGYVLKSLGG
jgi:hypothetical protein